MVDQIKIKSALISVYSKEGIADLAKLLESYQVEILSTGGTYSYLQSEGIAATPIEEITSYPSILGGRVKTLHPKIFGGILWRRNELADVEDVTRYEIPSVDMVIVDLYPFEKTVTSTTDEDEIIEKIDIGGISLIRAAAKNFRHVLVVPAFGLYDKVSKLLKQGKGFTSLSERKWFAAKAFEVSSHYDTEIFRYFNREFRLPGFKQSLSQFIPLRYGENPHQQGVFYGDLSAVFEQVHGKELSYNNLVDVEAAIQLTGEFQDPTAVVIKHTNPCGVASRSTLFEAWKDALACDPVSAFGGIISVNRPVDKSTAEEINKLFFEIIIADTFENEALELLKSKKNRIILCRKPVALPDRQFKSLLNGVIEQERDLKSEQKEDFRYVTKKRPAADEIPDLLFAARVVKHLKSNTIVLVKNGQLIGSGMGQTSRVDALKQAILKAEVFGFDTRGAVMASDAFFPFADSVEIADKAGIRAVIQPGGSIRDEDSIRYCDEHDMSMVFTGIRHFKH
ncbi:MAG: bifunctional phosphoribosylaminoimidazolecarboxamide formyltransferase/IMP cyclohydrolase PurH [Bacteroidetes bacterium]|nr:MAG: bifunctional phosphoribosylaminoimidazolecarboxamide formyltransferase/IMP cyclohydrolase PurH [Bacteroidota bacterium]